MSIETIVNSAIYSIIGIVVLFKLYASLVPEAMSAGNELNETGVPLGSFFVSDGIVFLLVMVGLFITVLRSVMKKGSK